MKQDFELQYHRLEKNHWWYVGRRNLIIQLLKKYPKTASVLDVGCSSGILLEQLKHLGFKPNNLYGIDISKTAIQNARKNGLKQVFVMDAQNIKIPKKKFDVIIASDCLEHLKDEKKALKSWKDLLKRDGVLIIFVPAFMSLWSHHDEDNLHYRRYTKSQLINALSSQGFCIERKGYWNFFLFFPVFIFRLLSRIVNTNNNTASNLQYFGNSFANKILTSLLIFENILLKLINFPFGISTFCIARVSDALIKQSKKVSQN